MVISRIKSAEQFASESALSLKHSRQDSAYLREAVQVQSAIGPSELLPEKRENRGQFALHEVVRGGGRAVYAIEDQNKIIKVLNAAFDVKDDQYFRKNLEVKLKDFQKDMISSDAGWRNLEARLNAKGKTLVDGLVGPLTIKAMLDRGLIKINSSGVLEALQSTDTQGANKRQNQNKKPETPIIAHESRDNIPPAKPTSERKPAETPPPIKAEPEQKPPETKRLPTPPIKPPEVKPPSAPVTPRESEIEKQLAAKFETLGIRLKEIESKIASAQESEKNFNEFKGINLTRANAGLEKISALDSQYANRELLAGGKIEPFGKDLGLSIKNTQKEMDQERDNRAQIIQKACAEKDKIKSEIAGIKSLNSSDQIKAIDAACSKLDDNCKAVRNVSEEISNESRRLKGVFEDIGRLTASTLEKYSGIIEGELQAYKNLASLNKDALSKYTKLHLSYLYDTENRKSQVTIDKTSMAFGKSFSRIPEDSLELYYCMTVSGAEKKGISFGMKFGPNRENFLKNLQAVSDNPDSLLSVAGRQNIKKYVNCLRQCEQLGIENPFRFTVDNLQAIVNERLNPQIDKPLLVITAAKNDHNGALHALNDFYADFAKQGYRIQYHELGQDSQINTALSQATANGKYKANVFLISGHGSQTSISLSDEDPLRRNNSETASSNSFSKNESPGSIEFSDLERIKETRKFIDDNATIILHSCSTGKGKKDETQKINNMANFFREAYPHARKLGIFSAVAPSWINEIKFKDMKVDSVEYGDQNGDIETYQADYSTRKNEFSETV